MADYQLSVSLKNRMNQILDASPLIPVITIEDPAQVVPLGDALVAGGLRVLEITLRTPHGLDAISRLRARHPDVWIGAGTVATLDQYRAVEDAGGQFVITPGLTRELLDYGSRATAPLLPGVATLSELMEGYRLGYRAFKFFPAEVAGGVAALKAFGGPFGDVRFCPTGGIRQATASDYLALANVAAVGGTWLTPESALSNGDWQVVTRVARDSLEAIRSLGT
ncbi:bifunctional 4-hydroxy-2-oxoglutarate aldolase/2-dehydro-3-deoxy-phosphogluconate aldolase [Marinobacter lacisalsi]|uniref:2-dehydro-3-deoxy-phosphogluconate aldolase n=1 Tax=Marinobacter lacisalsi TaxID=475979 RepID=A0ABV8QJX1_9GAMM